MKSISIIGAGAAGIMTAATILESSDSRDFHIHLFEKNNSPGKKVIISGGGRCNLTTGIEDKKILLSKYTRGNEFIKKALGKFSPKKCREWFESHGIPLKCESDNRVFPVSDDGSEVVEVFEKIFAKHRDRISLHYGEGVSTVSMFSSSGTKGRIQENEKQSMDSSFYSEGRAQEGILKQFRITTPKGAYESDILVITTGGNAYAHTGSAGDGYAFAKSLGHTITTLGPSLSSFLTRESWMHELSGLAFQNSGIFFSLSSLRSEDLSGKSEEVKRDSHPKSTSNLSFREKGACVENDKKIELSGPLLLTHFGISGPLAFILSSELAWETIDKNHPKEVYFTPLSDMDFASWEKFLKDQFQNHPKKLITNILTEKLPRRFVEVFVAYYFSHIETTFAASISRSEREKLSKLLGEGIPITLSERRPGDEFVTAGGVNTDEVNPETMESRIQKNLYFAGEVLNVDAVTGGFNLQACWAGGYSAGKDISEKINQTN
ncbi:MAG: NAD(P)/FAD-dependent oxidoreductase [Candidatus Gracilibacteria bacterium]|nr:NAD(P)/FAD-dependent oxidoreductase [Candidatus Gracilibacteria bacterium]